MTAFRLPGPLQIGAEYGISPALFGQRDGDATSGIEFQIICRRHCYKKVTKSRRGARLTSKMGNNKQKGLYFELQVLSRDAGVILGRLEPRPRNDLLATAFF
jgi:hypothetical protein